MGKLIVPVTGMHCRSCEVLIEDTVGEMTNVKKVKANASRQMVEVEYEKDAPNKGDIEESIKSLGYKIGYGKAERKSWFNEDAQVYLDFMYGMVFLFLGFVVFTSYFNFNIEGFLQNNSSFFGGAFFIGLVAGVSSCMAMVGGLVLGVSARWNEDHVKKTALQKLYPHFFFQLGRVVSFALFGAVLGLLGSAFKLNVLYIGVATLFVAFVMLWLGFGLTEFSPRLSEYKLTLPKSLSKFFGISSKNPTKSAFLLGASTFFLPCGFTFSMQMLAMGSGSPMYGGMIMALFALGTLPGLLGAGGISAFFKGEFGKKLFRFTGVLVLFFALFNLLNGMALVKASLNAPKFEAVQVDDPNRPKMTVAMIQGSHGYEPQAITVEKGKKITWKITSENPYTCASYIVVPALGIGKQLEKGENTIEFVAPDEAVDIPFSCSMGMYRGVIQVR